MNEDILTALKSVIDPEVGINIVDLGLVYRADLGASEINIDLTMTSPACPMGEMIIDDIRRTLQSSFPETETVNVELVWDPPWTPSLMSEEIRQQLGFPL
ncbi:MAG: metal-sulfur cluster assembly factor [Xanthobacteraceae bacterium]|nr:MAG: metal-sulfur cluster assembly factor [Xanthobacteraceae bacterium]